MSRLGVGCLSGSICSRKILSLIGIGEAVLFVLLEISAALFFNQLQT